MVSSPGPISVCLEGREGSNGERALEVRAVGRAGRTDCVKGTLKPNGAKEKR